MRRSIYGGNYEETSHDELKKKIQTKFSNKEIKEMEAVWKETSFAYYPRYGTS